MYIAMKTETFAKLFFLISFTGLIFYAILAFYTFHTAYTTVSDYETYHGTRYPNAVTFSRSEIDSQLKYVLVWTIPFHNVNIFGEGQEQFVKYNCSYSNCYLTSQSYLLNDDYRNFDALILDVGIVTQLRNVTIPHFRYPKQKFVFHSMQSANETPICLTSTDNYFNWTWSYKLSSDIVTPFIEVRDLNGNFVAPKDNVQWPKNMTELMDNDMEKLQGKRKAVAWIMDTCKERVNRMVFVKSFRKALSHHSLELDVFTTGCEKKTCPNDDCLKVIQEEYYYYLAYETSHADDYVTEEVLKAYDHYAVPIVRGGANYEVFLPEGSYLDSTKGSVTKLAAIVDYSIRNPELYYSFHRWRNHYVIKKVDPMRGLCDLCEYLNTDSKVKSYSSYESFRKWWYDGALGDRCFPRGAENLVEVLSYLNKTKRRHKML